MEEQSKEPETIPPPPSAQRTGPGEQLVEFEVEAVMAKRLYRNESGRTGLEYLVKWKNYTMDEATWEPEINLIGCEQLIDEFERLSRHCADLHRSSDVLPRRRGRPPKTTPKLERVTGFPRTYGDVSSSLFPEKAAQEVKKRNSDEDEYVDEQEESDADDFDVSDEGGRWDSRSRRRGRGRGRGRARGRGRGRGQRLSYRSRTSDDEDYYVRSGITRRRRGRRAGRARGRYARSGLCGYNNGQYVGYGGSASKNFVRKEVTQVVDLVKGEDEKSWAWVVFADGKQEYVPYNTARKNLIPQLLDMYECHLKFRPDEPENTSAVEATEEGSNKPNVDKEAEMEKQPEGGKAEQSKLAVQAEVEMKKPAAEDDDTNSSEEDGDFVRTPEPEGGYDYVTIEQIL